MKTHICKAIFLMAVIFAPGMFRANSVTFSRDSIPSVHTHKPVIWKKLFSHRSSDEPNKMKKLFRKIGWVLIGSSVILFFLLRFVLTKFLLLFLVGMFLGGLLCLIFAPNFKS